MKKLLIMLLISILVLSGCSSTLDNPYAKNTEIEVEECSTTTKEYRENGYQANVKVDIGYDSDYATRNYYAYTNEFGQFIYIYAEEVILLDASETTEVEETGQLPNSLCEDNAVDSFYKSSDYRQTSSYQRIIPVQLGATSNAYNTIVINDQSAGDIFDDMSDLVNAMENGAKVTHFEVDLIHDNESSDVPSSITYSFYIDEEFYTATYNL